MRPDGDIINQFYMAKLNLAIIFGAKSTEHEVSIVTAFQASDWIDLAKYNRYLIYINENNQAFLCSPPQKDPQKFIENAVRAANSADFTPGGISVGRGLMKKKINLDVALLTMHGAFGEDGKIQGMLDFYGIPYTGSGVLGSALKMDKVVQKDIFAKMGLPLIPYLWFFDNEYRKDPQKIKELIKKSLKYPLFVKPANGGSSIGIVKIDKESRLDKAVEEVSCYDHKILIEQSVEGAVDINCAVMGGYDSEVTVCEQPLTEDKFLSFKEKYLKGGKMKGMASLSRIIPAPIPDEITKQAREMAKNIFRELNCWGMARMDFLYQAKMKKIYPGEINTIPGALAVYLWEASGVKSAELIDRLVELALLKNKEARRLNYTYRSDILNQK
jgi:D-alanine-D-alanine ligase